MLLRGVAVDDDGLQTPAIGGRADMEIPLRMPQTLTRRAGREIRGGYSCIGRTAGHDAIAVAARLGASCDIGLQQGGEE